LAIAVPIPFDAPTERSKMSERNDAEVKKRYVLVVDANVDDRFDTCMLLQRFGYTIFTAHTAEEAVEFMTVAPPSAIVADAAAGGTTLLSWITKDPRFFHVPLILLSSSRNAELERRAKRGEFGAFLKKPIKTEEFYRIVQEVIEKGPRRNLRITTHLEVKLEDGLGGREGYATVLSEYGMFFRTLEPRPVNANIPLVLEIKGRLIKLEAVVLYITNFDEGPFKEPGMGLKFVKISREDRDLIAAFILERIEAGITRPGTQK
jgi:twitching motility two-component system response regulator PilH